MSTTTRELVIRDCYALGPSMQYPYAGIGGGVSANYGFYPVVDADSPVKFAGITYQPSAIAKSKLEYKTGFETSSLTLTLSPRGAERAAGMGESPYARADGTSFSEGVNSTSPYYEPYGNISGTQAFQDMRQGFASGDFYLAPVTLTRIFLSAPTVGGTVMFRGRVSDLEIDRLDIKITVSSLMEIFSQKVPSQIVMPGNRFLPWDFNATPDFTGSGTGVGSFSWFEATTSLVDNVLREGWGVFKVAGIGAWERRIFTNTGAFVYLLEPLPVDLGSVASGTLTFKAWESGNTVSVEGQPGQGFPSVPRPEVGVL